tara:strand:+ start:906 stop:1049 length:144 start_codon:yes stop_codon:yes gene_type:complete
MIFWQCSIDKDDRFEEAGIFKSEHTAMISAESTFRASDNSLTLNRAE